jgi:hypothetical protein
LNRRGREQQEDGENYIKAIPLQAWAGPEGSRRFRLPDFKTIDTKCGKVVSPTYRPTFTPRKYF